MITITQATASDIPDVHAMIQALCAHHGDICTRNTADTHTQFINGPLVGLIAHDEGKPVGFATLVRHWRPMDAGDTIDILHLFVVGGRRGQGIGRKLIRSAQTHARKTQAARLTIGTSPRNPDAAAAYRAMGWDEITGATGPRFQIGL